LSEPIKLMHHIANALDRARVLRKKIDQIVKFTAVVEKRVEKVWPDRAELGVPHLQPGRIYFVG
jgi:hypothetical protein